jgi:hypothetical protein
LIGARQPPRRTVQRVSHRDLAEALGGDDRLNFRNARIELAVDHVVIVFRPVAHFFGGFRHARGDGGGAVLGAHAQARFERGAAAFDPLQSSRLARAATRLFVSRSKL